MKWALFLVLELQRGYLYENGVEFHHKVIVAGLNLFWGHLHYFLRGLGTFPSLSDTRVSAPIAERTILLDYQQKLPQRKMLKETKLTIETEKLLFLVLTII